MPSRPVIRTKPRLSAQNSSQHAFHTSHCSEFGSTVRQWLVVIATVYSTVVSSGDFGVCSTAVVGGDCDCVQSIFRAVASSGVFNVCSAAVMGDCDCFCRCCRCFSRITPG